MHSLDLHAPLGDHIGSHRGINAAGQQAHGSTAHTGGQSARTRLRRAMNIGCQVPNLHIYRIFRMVHVHLHSGMGFRQSAADLLGQLNGGHGEPLVRTLGLHLEGLGAVQVVPQIILDGGENGIHILLTGAAATKAHKAENGVAGLPGSLHIRLFVQGLHIHRRLHEIYVKIAVGLHPAADILPQTPLELPLIGTLQDDLAQLQQKNLFHRFPFLIACPYSQHGTEWPPRCAGAEFSRCRPGRQPSELPAISGRSSGRSDP